MLNWAFHFRRLTYQFVKQYLFTVWDRRIGVFGHHPPRLVRGQSILQRPFGRGAQKRRLAGVDRAWW